jgi:hypothetical protein
MSGMLLGLPMVPDDVQESKLVTKPSSTNLPGYPSLTAGWSLEKSKKLTRIEHGHTGVKAKKVVVSRLAASKRSRK